MKKLIALLLALVMVCCLFACGNDNGSDGTTEATKGTTEPTKNESTMTYAEYVAAELETEVTVACYVQATQAWWDNKITVYAADKDGAYFLYEMACSQEDAAKLTPGTLIKVTGTKSAWAGEVEIMDGTFEFVEGGENYIAEVKDLTDKIASDELINYQNQLATFKELTVKELSFKNDGGDDIYVTLTKDGKDYNFCVEVYLTGTDSEVYTTVSALKTGDVVDVDCFLYWYEGANPHIVGIKKAASIDWQDANQYFADRAAGYAGLSDDEKELRKAINESVNLRLSGNIDMAELFGEYVTITLGQDTLGYQINIDLNGFTWNQGNRRISVQKNTTVNIQDSSQAGTGTLIGNGYNSSTHGGVFILTGSNATLNLYSGTLTSDPTAKAVLSKGGIVYVTKTAVFNMYGGTVTGGKVIAGEGAGGGNVHVHQGTFNMYGGTISNGTAVTGGNVYLRDASSAVCNMYGGTITGGTAEEEANVYVGAAATFNKEGGTVGE